jgi:hypothetical protein
MGLLAASAFLLVAVAGRGIATGVGASADAQGGGDSQARLSGPVPSA